MNSRMSLDEVQEIARLASQRRFVVHGAGPDVQRVADALGLSPSQVEGLLNEVRDRRGGFLPPDRSHLAKPTAIGFGILAALCALAFLINLVAGLQGGASVATRPNSSDQASGSAPSLPNYTASLVAPQVAQESEPPSPKATPTPSQGFDSGLSSGSLSAGRAATKDTAGDLHNAFENAKAARMIAATPTPPAD